MLVQSIIKIVIGFVTVNMITYFVVSVRIDNTH